MKSRAAVLLALPALWAAGACWADEARLDLKHRWVYVSTNLLVERNVAEAIALFERAAKAGYNGIVLTDSKFMRWDNLPQRYLANVRRVREACRKYKLACVACVCPIGYSNSLLAREPNLAAGLPVREAPFVVRGGRLHPADEVELLNGGFEQYRGHRPGGWAFVDMPGQISFIDTQVKSSGRASLRLQDIGRHNPEHGNGRAMQRLKVRPYRQYHVSAMVRTEDFASADRIRVLVLGGAVTLNHHTPPIARTQAFKRIDVAFNSLACDEVGLYLGVWGGKGGRLWWDDVRVEPAGLVNVVRRAGAPLRVVSEDGATVYEEGRDFTGADDPLLGTKPYGGCFSAWHAPPLPAVPPGSRLREGQRVLLSYYHTAVIYKGQVMCDMAEPKVCEIVDWQVRRVRQALEPDGYFMQHDEIRVQGWEPAFEDGKLTPAAALGDNVRRCTAIIGRHDPGKPVYVWSDMFDPYHNARKTGRYYLVRGDGPWYGSWEHLPRQVVVVNWHGHKAGRLASMQHFAGRGHRQILAGYYDGPPERIADWLSEASKVDGVVGVLYTTWRRNYDDLEAFAAAVKKFSR